MTDEKFIYDFLDNGYKVTIGSTDYLFVELETNKILPHKSTYGDNMLNEFIKIIGNFDTDTGESSTNVLHRWYMEQSKIVGKELNKFIESYDDKEGFSVILNEAFSKFGSDYNKPFLRTKIGEHYKHKYLITKVQDYLDTLDYTKGSKKLVEEIKKHFDDDIDDFKDEIYNVFNRRYDEFILNEIDKYLTNIDKDITIDELIEKFKFDIEAETETHRHQIVKLLKDWYHINILNDKLLPFFNELIVTMGSTNWLVTWVGHGRLTEEKMLNHFKDEETYSKNYIRQRYEEWHSEKIIEISDKYMKNGW
jgi:hypothetical protein